MIFADRGDASCQPGSSRIRLVMTGPDAAAGSRPSAGNQHDDPESRHVDRRESLHESVSLRRRGRAGRTQNRVFWTRYPVQSGQLARTDSAVCSCLSWLRYARLSRYVTGSGVIHRAAGAPVLRSESQLGMGRFVTPHPRAWPCRIPGRSGWLRCELGTGAQAGVVRGGAPGGGAAVGDGLAGAGDDRRDEAYGQWGVRVDGEFQHAGGGAVGALHHKKFPRP